MLARITIVVGVLLAFVPCLPAADKDAPQTYGWRGNWTGLYPDSKAPIE